MLHGRDARAWGRPSVRQWADLRRLRGKRRGATLYWPGHGPWPHGVLRRAAG